MLCVFSTQTDNLCHCYCRVQCSVNLFMAFTSLIIVVVHGWLIDLLSVTTLDCCIIISILTDTYTYLNIIGRK